MLYFWMTVEQGELNNGTARVINIPIKHENHSTVHSNCDGLDPDNERVSRSSSQSDVNEQLVNSLKVVDELKHRFDVERSAWSNERETYVKSIEEVGKVTSLLLSCQHGTSIRL